MFLCLKAAHPDKFLVPCYDIDIAWHTHQVMPVSYELETTSLLGAMLSHDDSVNDRAPGSKLSNSSSMTAKLWKETFDKDFRQPGTYWVPKI